MPTKTNSQKTKEFKVNIRFSTRMVASAILILGLISLAASAFYGSTILAFIGLGLTFWGALLLYITPTRYVKLELLNAVAPSTLANIEKILASTKLNDKGIYLPPSSLSRHSSSAFS
jgi:uncharacterized membrane protein